MQRPVNYTGSFQIAKPCQPHQVISGGNTCRQITIKTRFTFLDSNAVKPVRAIRRSSTISRNNSSRTGTYGYQTQHEAQRAPLFWRLDPRSRIHTPSTRYRESPSDIHSSEKYHPTHTHSTSGNGVKDYQSYLLLTEVLSVSRGV